MLTGECQILSADIFYDCGQSLNPDIDIGQVEGCFVQAAGFCLTEELTRSATDGRLISNGASGKEGERGGVGVFWRRGWLRSSLLWLWGGNVCVGEGIGPPSSAVTPHPAPHARVW